MVIKALKMKGYFAFLNNDYIPKKQKTLLCRVFIGCQNLYSVSYIIANVHVTHLLWQVFDIILKLVAHINWIWHGDFRCGPAARHFTHTAW